MEAAAAETNAHMTAQYDTKNPQAQLRAFPRPVMQAAYKAAFQLYGELAKQSPQFKRIYAWLAYRNDEYLWFRVSGHSFENFVYAAVAT